MNTLIDIIGQRFGRLTVLQRAGTAPSGGVMWICACDCGQTITASGSNLKRGNVSSCGCLRRELVSAYRKEHGIVHGAARKAQKTPTYTTWQSMWDRCRNPKATHYNYYGGRGITVCERWKSFECFLEDMGERPPDKTLDRWPNHEGPYEKSNCRWATKAEQRYNQRKRDPYARLR